MYGLVNQAVADLATRTGGPDLWDRVRADAGLAGTSFVAMDAYDDDVTARLVRAASGQLGISEADVLRAFGRHWVLFTGQEGYGSLLSAMGRTLPEVLVNLDAMHARIAFTMPELRPPSFACREVSSTRLELRYRSHRVGLLPMVEGLLTGLGELLDRDVNVWSMSLGDADAPGTDVLLVVDHRPTGAGT